MAAPTVFQSNATISTTERSLPADTTTGVPTSQTTKGRITGFVDLMTLAAADVFRITLYAKVNGGTQRIVETWDIAGPQVWKLPADLVINETGWELSCIKVSGTDQIIRWYLVVEPIDVLDANLTLWLGSAPLALSFQRPEVLVGSMASNVITAAAINSNAFTAAKFATDCIGAAQLAADAVDEIWDEAHEGSETVRQAVRLMRSVIVGKGNTLTTNPAFRDIANTKDRVAYTMSGGGATRTPTTDAT